MARSRFRSLLSNCIDAIHRETVATEAFYVLLGLKEDHTREVLGIINIPQESASGWQEVLESLFMFRKKLIEYLVN